MKKILIFYGSYGGGHLSAARNIKEYIDNNYTDTETCLVDCIEYINKTLISAGDTPEILEACPIDIGFILSNFCLASKLIPFKFL